MNYNNIAPVGSFIHTYMQHMQHVETATSYDFWCAMWALSCAAGRDIVVDRPRAPVYLNVYAILVAESGITRKSSAVRTITDIVQQFNEQEDAFAFIQSKSTAEFIERTLHTRTASHSTGRIAISISELATFLGMEKYTITIPALLTHLYDCPANAGDGGTTTGGLRRAKDVWISFLSASTPSWLYKSVNPNVIAGGFTSRCLFIVEEQPKKRIAWPEEKEGSSDEVVRQQLTQMLSAIRKSAYTYKRIAISDGGLRSFRNWYTRRNTHYDEFRSSFESREDAHCLRVAALLSINDGSWEINKAHISHSIRIVAAVKESASRLFEGNTQHTKWVQGIVGVRDSLLAAGTDPISRSRLYLSCRKKLDNAEFDALLDVLHESGAIQRFEIKQSKGRPITLYRGTTLLTKRNFVEGIVEQLGR